MSDDGRLSRLKTSVSKLRTRSGRGGSIERWLMYAGAAMTVIGIAWITLGWFGAARTPYVFEQVPYLISGGLLGLALAVVGGLFYFAYWISRQVQETRKQAEQTRDSLEQIRELLANSTIATAGRQAVQASTNGGLVATEKGTMFHRPDCVVVAGRDDLRPIEPDAEGFEPCRICDPLAVA